MNEIMMNKDGIKIPIVETVTIPVEEYKELLMARTRLNILSEWTDSGETLRQADVQHICGTYKKAGDIHDII